MKSLVIDTSYLTYRSFFGYPGFTNSKSTPLGAVYGFIKTVITFQKRFQPDYLIFAKDLPTPTFRDKLFDSYKAGRAPTPPEMITQIPLLNQWLEVTCANVLELDGYEADDMIASYCRQNDSHDILVFSGDRDLYQLLAMPHVKMLLSDKFGGIRTFEAGDFSNKYELNPDQWLDYKALVGDGSDNIAGVSGIGPKTATTLLRNLGSLQSIYKLLGVDFAASLPDQYTYTPPKTSPLNQSYNIPERLSKMLISDLNKVVLAYQLSRLAYPELATKFSPIHLHLSLDLLREWEFKSILKELEPNQNIAPIQDAQTSLF